MSEYRYVPYLIVFTLLGKYGASRPSAYQPGQYRETQNPVIVAVESLHDESMAQPLRIEHPFDWFLIDYEENLSGSSSGQKPKIRDPYEIRRTQNTLSQAVISLYQVTSSPDSRVASSVETFQGEQPELLTPEASGGDVGMANSESAEQPKHVCPGCHKHFCTKSDMKRHIETVHLGEIQLPEIVRSNVCTFVGCNKSFKNKIDLKKHVRKNHSDEPLEMRQYSCMEVGCTRSFNKRSELVVHMKRRHKKKMPTQYECKACKRLFPTYGETYDHRKMDHEVILKCETCPKVCRNQRELSAHRRTHARAVLAESNHKQHKCQMQKCKRAYSSRSALLLHVRMKHPKAQDTASQTEHTNDPQSNQERRASGMTRASTNDVVGEITVAQNVLEQNAIVPGLMCRICEIQYASLYNFMTHIKKKHPNRAAKAVCGTADLLEHQDAATCESSSTSTRASTNDPITSMEISDNVDVTPNGTYSLHVAVKYTVTSVL